MTLLPNVESVTHGVPLFLSRNFPRLGVKQYGGTDKQAGAVINQPTEERKNGMG